MPRNTKAVYHIVTTYGIDGEMVFTLNKNLSQNKIVAVNSKTGQYHFIPYVNDIYSDFLYTCESFIKEHFGKHLIYYVQKSYQRGEQ